MRYLLFLIIILSIGFTSCGNDDGSDISVSYAGTTYQGRTETIDSSNPRYFSSTIYPEINISYPEIKGFKADAFFVIKGSINASNQYQYSLLKVKKNSTGEETNYWLSGNFDRKIWLRFGSGSYSVIVYKTEITSNNLNYEGDILSYSYVTQGVYQFNVDNIRFEDGTFFYPSDPVQSDDPEIYNLAQSIVSGETSDYDKIKALHDYTVSYLYYDDDSLVDGQRKKQDAISTLNNKTAVCEGYTSLFNAMLRSLGFRSKCIAGGDHAWSSIYHDGAWKESDTTWDDGPDDTKPDNILWTYFDKTKTFFEATHTYETERPDRSISDTVSSWVGYPDGIY